MKIRVSLVIVILAALSITGMNLVQVRSKIVTLQTNLKEQTAARGKAETDLASTRGDLERINGVLRQTTTALETAKADNQVLTANVEARKKEIKELGERLG